ncbi:TolC family protein [Silvibacterium sp.]|uniref:TolC family protein n=1 Tax=Silvibacterium sp. TaxID=1964179 RepID=UPI0039E6982C
MFLTYIRPRASILWSVSIAAFAASFLTPLPAFAQQDDTMHLTLAQAIDLAMKQNRDLKLASLNIDDATHKKAIARSAYYPKISNDSKMTYITELAGVAIPAGAFGDFSSTGKIPGKTLFLDQGSSLSYTSGTSLDQPVTQLIRIHEANRSAASDLRSAGIDLERGQDDVTLKVRQLYYQALILQQKQQAADDEIAAAQIKLDESQRDVTNGNALQVAALQGRAALLEARQEALATKLSLHDTMLSLADLLGLPVHSAIVLDPDTASADAPLPSRAECLRITEEQNPDLRLAMEAITKAHAGVAAARDNYIPDITALAHYSYQSGVPLLVHNFGIFGFSFTYDLFDGGKRIEQIKDAHTELEEAEMNRQKVEEELAVQIESAYDKVEQWSDMVSVAQEAMRARTEAARLADRQFEQNAMLASARSEAHAQQAASGASLLEAELNLSLAQADVRRILGDNSH